MRGPLWRIQLLFSFFFFFFFFFFTICNTLDGECVLGIVGQPLRLSCFYPDALALADVSAEWRRNEDEVARDDGDDDDALRTGNFTLRLPAVDAREDNASYSVIVSSRGNASVEACRLCLRVTAPFSPPELTWEPAAADAPSVFQCDTGGGFPEPVVSWLIDEGVREVPEGSVETLVELRPDSHLYYVTSYLTVNVTDTNVSCVVRNTATNLSLASTTHAVWHGPVVTRATDALWVFSTALCVVVGAMVAVGLAYQIHLDRVSKMKKQVLSRRNRGYRRRQHTEETEAVMFESCESNV
ncbi:V-set domain-containing T-cell activation inhibitor 1-like isoform X2 [Syngnathoides biaculeatus]|uniref:V-set domain-containing T-cell activation inhibitor 1-like isoform X2 n=1 Tax=Syngnathoides biaculeatus TaxID=300417 RepID=UPI002ADD90E4|nr:V-set domain-containing T-cell activation inhibitor 1-like isoform X2 [Syngnathoides biaculeatus]